VAESTFLIWLLPQTRTKELRHDVKGPPQWDTDTMGLAGSMDKPLDVF